VFINVKDEGVGIPSNKIDIIFERFGQVDSSLTRQAEGTGIGLSLVKSLTSAMGGTISVESEINHGSTFMLCLPREKVQETECTSMYHDQADDRIMQSVAIEFSDIYYD